MKYICLIEAWTNKSFNMAESACLQCMSSAFDWSNSTCQPFFTSNWHFWQKAQMSDKCLWCKTEKAQISGQMQIICTGWGLCNGSPLGSQGPHGDLFGDLGPLFLHILTKERKRKAARTQNPCNDRWTKNRAFWGQVKISFLAQG